MTSHTKEPWRPFDGAKFAMLTKDGICSDEEAEANARRIFTCVNACAGISNELLDAGPIVEIAGQMAKRVSDSEKDALRQRVSELEDRIANAVAEEREACAKICDFYDAEDTFQAANEIRARSNKLETK